MFSFIQRQHSEPSQPTSECLQVATQRCLDRAHECSIDHRKLLRIEVIKKCTLTEIPTALLVTAERSLDRFDAGCLIRDLFIFRSTVKSCFWKNICAAFISSRQASARIIIEGHLAAFQTSF